MSDPRTKAERSAAKDIRQGVEPQREHPQVDLKRKRRAKPWKLMWRAALMGARWPGGWCWGRYATAREAHDAAERQKRKFGGEWNVVDPETKTPPKGR